MRRATRTFGTSSWGVTSSLQSSVAPIICADVGEHISYLSSNGVDVHPLPLLGANVRGLDLRNKPSEEVLEALQHVCAHWGFLNFKDQGVMNGDEQVTASEYFGGRQMHSTHGVHPRAPNKHIFRLSNDEQHGILGVGPQWQVTMN